MIDVQSKDMDRQNQLVDPTDPEDHLPEEARSTLFQNLHRLEDAKCRYKSHMIQTMRLRTSKHLAQQANRMPNSQSSQCIVVRILLYRNSQLTRLIDILGEKETLECTKTCHALQVREGMHRQQRRACHSAM